MDEDDKLNKMTRLQARIFLAVDVWLGVLLCTWTYHGAREAFPCVLVFVALVGGANLINYLRKRAPWTKRQRGGTDNKTDNTSSLPSSGPESSASLVQRAGSPSSLDGSCGTSSLPIEPKPAPTGKRFENFADYETQLRGRLPQIVASRQAARR